MMSNFSPKTNLYDSAISQNTLLKNQRPSDTQISDEFEYSPIVKSHRFFARLALKLRNILLAIPVIRGRAFNENTSYSTQDVPETEAFFNAERYMCLNSVDFICMMYLKLLGREVDEVGLDEKIRFFQRGGSKEAIIYSIYISAEFKNRFKIKHIDRYKKAYNKNRAIILLRRIPLLSAYARAKAIDRALVDMRALIISNNTSAVHSVSALNDSTTQDIST